MKRIFIVLLLFIVSFAFGADGPKIEFESDSVNFGKAKSRSQLTFVFKFKNTGNSTLVIDEIVSG